MTTQSRNEQNDRPNPQKGAPGIVKAAESSAFVQEGVKPAQGFFKKFSNDGVMVFSAALAYNVLTAILPIAIALLSIVGLTLGQLNPSAQQSVYNQIVKALPGTITQGANLQDLIFHKLPNASSIIGIIAILAAIFGGSRLFVSIEYVFGIIYRVRQRKFVQQNIMAILMLLAFVILIPVMALASSIPTIVASLFQTSLKGTPIATFPLLTFLIPVAGIVGGILAGFLLFLTIYMVIPNQKISFRNSWKGALLAAVLIEIYLGLFPLYVSRFLSGYVGQVGFALILLAFFYYFAVILLLGAEINSYFSEHIESMPETLVGMVHIMTNHLNTNQQQDKANPTNPQPTSSQDNDTTRKVSLQQTASVRTFEKSQDRLADKQNKQADKQNKPSFFSNLKSKLPGGKKKASKQADPTRESPKNTVIEIVLGTALTLIIETLRSRRKA